MTLILGMATTSFRKISPYTCCCISRCDLFILHRRLEHSAPITYNSKTACWTKPEGHDTGIKIWNSLTKRQDPLILTKSYQATWYNCGPTVYDSAHVGHASTAVRLDILRRILTNFFDINVIFVQSVTDIDDKIIKRSNEMGIPMEELTKLYEYEYNNEMNALNVLPPTIAARVMDHIPHIISFTKAILDMGYAYTTPSGSVYFDVQKYGRYGRLSPASISTESESAEKKNAFDFALWKAAKPKEPYWSSPWGNGRPGWHIECSAMSSVAFGDRIDIHSGGEDLQFPHHENELAQSQAFHCCDQWVNYWLHTGQVNLKGDQKMSKSLKNYITVSRLLKDYSPDEFRMFCLLSRYNNRVEYSPDTMQKAVSLTQQVRHFQHLCQSYLKGQISCHPIPEAEFHESLVQSRKDILAALCDDFGTPKVMDILTGLMKYLNIYLARPPLPQQQSRSVATVAAVSIFIQETLWQLGFDEKKAATAQSSAENVNMDYILDSVVNFRQCVRDFALNPPMDLLKPADRRDNAKPKRLVVGPLLKACDQIRSDLKVANIQIKDLKNESSWVRIDNKQKQKPEDGS